MLFRRAPRAVAVIAGLACLAAASTAHAQSKDPAALKLACVQASDKAQQLRVAGKLVAARDVLQTCVLDACPAVVREACSQWLGEVEASLPSIVIGAKDGDGKDLLDLKVSIDGTLVTEHLGGRAVPIDPGRHKMRYEKPDGTILEEDILVGEGAKNRAVSIAFPAPVKVAATTTAPAPAPSSASTHKGPSTANTAVGIVLAAVGAGGLATALALDLTTNSSVNADQLTCGKTMSCPASTVSGYRLDYDLAGVSLGVGIAALGVATYVFLAHPLGTAVSDAAPSARAKGPSFQIVPSPRGAGLALAF